MKTLHNINRIVFYGCSFTVGSELADIELFPGLSKLEINKLKLKERYSVYNRFEGSYRDKLDNQKSWARWFSDEIGLPWVNRASGGASMGQIVFSIERDLSNGNLEDTDLIVVGITSPERICRFNKSGAESLILNHLDTRWTNESFRKNFIIEMASDEYIQYNWFKEIKYLDLLSTRLGGRLFQQWVWATMKENFIFHDNGKPFYNLADYMQKIVHPLLNFDSIIDNEFSFTTLDAWSPENQEVFHHPNLRLHKQFGKHLAQKFKNQVTIHPRVVDSTSE